MNKQLTQSIDVQTPVWRVTQMAGACALLLGTALAQAQGFPSAAPLQGGREPAPAPARASTPPVAVPAATASRLGGATTVGITGVTFTGNSVFTADQLKALIEIKPGVQYTLDQLNGWTRSVSAHYQNAGYPFASAFLPQQKIEGGMLTIEVIEGRYGQISSTGDFVATEAAPFLEALAPGNLIEAKLLERTMLIIDDLPMIDVSPTVKPGGNYGTGDLVVDITRLAKDGGEVGVDNLGSRYTGEYRLRLNHNLYSRWRMGDEVRLKLLLSDRKLVLGSVDYELPIKGQGMRWQLGLARTSYQLAREYAALKATGVAEVFSTRLSYPFVRTQAHNLSGSIGFVGKRLKDEMGLTNSSNTKSSVAVPLTVLFDRRDSFGGGGLFYGNVMWTFGHLSLDDNLRQIDSQSARTQGQFQKIGLELARIQTLPLNFSLFVRYANQQSNKNLDSSEKFSLGGIYGVRAYPSGQGVGDKGSLGQIELRQKFGDVTGFVFYDQGTVSINADPWNSASSAKEKVSGSGLGLRREMPKGWNWELILAFRNSSALPSDNSNKGPRALASATYRY